MKDWISQAGMMSGVGFASGASCSNLSLTYLAAANTVTLLKQWSCLYQGACLTVSNAVGPSTSGSLIGTLSVLHSVNMVRKRRYQIARFCGISSVKSK